MQAILYLEDQPLGSDAPAREIGERNVQIGDEIVVTKALGKIAVVYRIDPPVGNALPLAFAKIK